jgi:hypothetical protein
MAEKELAIDHIVGQLLVDIRQRPGQVVRGYAT